MLKTVVKACSQRIGAFRLNINHLNISQDHTHKMYHQTIQPLEWLFMGEWFEE